MLDASALRRGHELGQLALHYQPIVKISSGSLDGIQALLRWHVRGEGTRPAAEFAHLLAEGAPTAKVTPDVVRLAARARARLPMEHGARYAIGVHVRPQDLLRQHAIQFFTEVTERARIDPELLQLDLSRLHTTAPEVLGHVAQAVRQLRALGLRVAADDLHLMSAPEPVLEACEFDAVKISVSGLGGSEGERMPVVRAFLGASEAAVGAIVAKRVESTRELEQVRSLGATHASGFLFGQPVDEAEIAEVAEDALSSAAAPDETGTFLSRAA